MSTFRSRFLTLVLAACACAAASADAPGQLVMSKPFTGAPRLFTHSLERYRSIERIALGDLVANLVPLPAIRHDGTLVVLGTPGTPLTMPPASLGQVVRAAVSTRCGAAIQVDGSLVRWPESATQPGLPRGAWVDLATYGSNIAGLTAAGSLHVWNDAGLVASTTPAAGARSITLGGNFGTTLDSVGMLAGFGINGAPAPAVPSNEGLRMVSFPPGAASSVIQRGVGIRTDGTLVGLALAFSATTPSGYVDAHVSRPNSATSGVNRIAALRADGTVDEFAETTTGWAPEATQWYGQYDSVLLTNTNRRIGVWASDTDRDGEVDSAQIARGEMPDANGDGIDDRIQLASPVHDGNRNGRMDAEDSATICGDPSGAVNYWYYLYQASTHGIVEMIRIPRGAETIRGVSLVGIQNPVGADSSTEATYCIWRDPNGDGSPDDAVLLSATPVTFASATTGMVDVHFPVDPVHLGEPGDVLFHGFVYYGKLPVSVAPIRRRPEPADLDTTPLNASIWAAAETGFGHDPTMLIRRHAAPIYLEYGGYGFGNQERFQIALQWGERRPLDCDQSGLFDAEQSQYASMYDLDGDGTIDACEGDCDSDGSQDLTEILDGAADCDRNLRLDSCDEASSFSETIPVPAPGEPQTVESGPIGIPVGNVYLSVGTKGDFGSPTEFVTVQLGDLPPREIFDSDVADCGPYAIKTVVTRADWISAMDGGRMRMTVRSSSFVDPAQCPGGYVRLSFNYVSGGQDCDGNGVADPCEAHGQLDCDGNGIPDSCDLAAGSPDIDTDGRLDACQTDCNGNGLPDDFELANSASGDCDGNGLIDTCEGGDCDADGVPDRCEVLSGAPDCNGDLVPDACQTVLDCDGNGLIDTCGDQVDCDGDGLTDACQIFEGGGDKDGDLRLDTCEYARGDFNLDDQVNGEDLAFVLSVWGSNSSIADLNRDGIVNGADLASVLTRWGPLY